jgi:AraC-like DNA-binding protein
MMEQPSRVIGECRTYGEQGCTHDHPYAQLILPLQGCLWIETPNHQLPLTETQLFYLPPHCQHHFWATRTNQFLVLDLPVCTIPQSLERMSGGRLSTLDPRWQGLRQLLLTELRDVPPQEQNLAPLAQYAYGLLAHQTQPRSLHYLHTHYDRPLNTQTLAQIEGYTLTYYCDWFKQQTGMTPKQYLQALRMQKAKELLSHTDDSVATIAHQVGYDHPASLTRLFQHLEGRSPVQYRQQCRASALGHL